MFVPLNSETRTLYPGHRQQDISGVFLRPWYSLGPSSGSLLTPGPV